MFFISTIRIIIFIYCYHKKTSAPTCIKLVKTYYSNCNQFYTHKQL